MSDAATLEPFLISEEQAAELIGLTPRFLQARRYQGTGPPFVRISSRCIRYRPDDIRRWAADRLVNSTSDPGAD